jgi:hypothetical protein
MSECRPAAKNLQVRESPANSYGILNAAGYNRTPQRRSHSRIVILPWLIIPADVRTEGYFLRVCLCRVVAVDILQILKLGGENIARIVVRRNNDRDRRRPEVCCHRTHSAIGSILPSYTHLHTFSKCRGGRWSEPRHGDRRWISKPRISTRKPKGLEKFNTSMSPSTEPNGSSQSVATSKTTPFRYTASAAFIDTLITAGVKYLFVNLGTDHPGLVEVFAHASMTKRKDFPRVLTCPNEMVALTIAHRLNSGCRAR